MEKKRGVMIGEILRGTTIYSLRTSWRPQKSELDEERERERFLAPIIAFEIAVPLDDGWKYGIMESQSPVHQLIVIGDG